MPYSLRIKHLEESYNVLGRKIEDMEKSEAPDAKKLSEMYGQYSDLHRELGKLARLQFESNEFVESDDE